MAGKIRLPASVSHGTENAYANYGCRCEPCRIANSAYQSERRARDPEKHTTYMREYMRRYRERKRERDAAPGQQAAPPPRSAE